MKKTMKREVAVAGLSALFVCAAFALAGPTPEIIEARGAIVLALSGPVFSFAAFAFGAEWISKQTNWGGDPRELDAPVAPDGAAG